MPSKNGLGRTLHKYPATVYTSGRARQRETSMHTTHPLGLNWYGLQGKANIQHDRQMTRYRNSKAAEK